MATAEFEHKPSKAKKTYRIVVPRKFIIEERGQLTLGGDFRHFFYVTNDRTLSHAEVIAESNARCNSGKPHRAAQERRSCAACPGQHAERQLGVHGHRVWRGR